MLDAKLIKMTEKLVTLANEEAENIKELQNVIAISGTQDDVFSALKEGIEFLSYSHTFRTRLAYEARKAAYDNDKITVSLCVNGIEEDIERSAEIRKKMSLLITKTIGVNHE